MSVSNANGSNEATETPVVLLAINLTLRTVERRSRNYRNLVMAVTFTVIASLLLAFFLRSWIALAGLIALPVWVGLFLFFDNRAVNAWRMRVFQMQAERGLSVVELEKLLTGFRHLPKATLRSMLMGLISEKPQA